MIGPIGALEPTDSAWSSSMRYRLLMVFYGASASAPLSSRALSLCAEEGIKGAIRTVSTGSRGGGALCATVSSSSRTSGDSNGDDDPPASKRIIRLTTFHPPPPPNPTDPLSIHSSPRENRQCAQLSTRSRQRERERARKSTECRLSRKLRSCPTLNHTTRTNQWRRLFAVVVFAAAAAGARCGPSHRRRCGPAAAAGCWRRSAALALAAGRLAVGQHTECTSSKLEHTRSHISLFFGFNFQTKLAKKNFAVVVVVDFTPYIIMIMMIMMMNKQNNHSHF